MRVIPMPLVAALALSACAGYGEAMPPDPPEKPAEEPIARAPQGGCDAALVQSFVGAAVSADTGAQIIAQSGAARLRWLAPDSAMTMDYRPDRVNVFFDSSRMIERITCG